MLGYSLDCKRSPFSSKIRTEERREESTVVSERATSSLVCHARCHASTVTCYASCPADFREKETASSLDICLRVHSVHRSDQCSKNVLVRPFCKSMTFRRRSEHHWVVYTMKCNT